MVMTIASVLNYWNGIGVFSYVLPFLLVFAVVYAILKKTQILGDTGNNAIYTIVAAAVGLLALQYDMVPLFFANIFPKFGVMLAILLAALILMGMTNPTVVGTSNWVKWVGVIGGGFVVLWALNDFMFYGGFAGGFYFWNEYIWSILVLAAVAGAVYWVSRSN